VHYAKKRWLLSITRSSREHELYSTPVGATDGGGGGGGGE